MGEVIETEPYMKAKITPFPDAEDEWNDKEREALNRVLQEMSMEVIQTQSLTFHQRPPSPLKTLTLCGFWCTSSLPT